MPFFPYTVKKIPVRAPQTKLGSRFAVVETISGGIVSRFTWEEAAELERRRLSRAAGACPECAGAGTVPARYERGLPVDEACRPCLGSGRKIAPAGFPLQEPKRGAAIETRAKDETRTPNLLHGKRVGT
jgi:hypothetical protein